MDQSAAVSRRRVQTTKKTSEKRGLFRLGPLMFAFWPIFAGVLTFFACSLAQLGPNDNHVPFAAGLLGTIAIPFAVHFLGKR